MLGSLIGGAIKIGGSIFGGIKASEAMKRVKASIANERERNEDWFNRRYNEDATQRADAQRVLNAMDERIRSRSRAAAAGRAVTGGTDEAEAAAKAANVDAMAEAASQIALSGERRKDAVESEYRLRDAQLDAQLNNLEAGKATAIGQAVKGLGSVSGGIADALDTDYLKER